MFVVLIFGVIIATVGTMIFRRILVSFDFVSFVTLVIMLLNTAHGDVLKLIVSVCHHTLMREQAAFDFNMVTASGADNDIALFNSFIFDDKNKV